MNTTVYLIRHGEVEYKRDDQGRRLIYGSSAHLSVEGEKQIERLAQKLKQDGVRFDALYTSPYTRATQSTKILWDIFGEPRLRIRNGLHDIWAPGWIGVTMEELEKNGGTGYSLPPRSEDQETLEEMKNRIVTIFNVILKETRGKTIGIVGHGDPTRALIGTFLGEASSSPIVRDQWYYGKGEAWKLEFDESLHLLETPQLIRGENTVVGSPERKIY